MIKVLSIFGTRPEAIKMSPVVKALEVAGLDSVVCVTAQHREMLDMVLKAFKVAPKHDLDIMQQGQSLNMVTSRVLEGLSSVLQEEVPDIVLVHGDTTTTFAASLAAFYAKIPIGHVEAGLRTYNNNSPYPEEVNRRLTAVMADMHFAPTLRAKENLLHERVLEKNVFVTGNTAIDAIKYSLESLEFDSSVLKALDLSKRIILLTAHRRESYEGGGLRNICRAIKRLTESFDDIHFVYPVHPNSNVGGIVYEELRGNPSISLVEPLGIQDMHRLLSKSYMVMTDSGGLQEEAPYLNKPALVLREHTERPEGVDAGCLILCGTDTDGIVHHAARLLQDEGLYQQMAQAENPFGDGLASQRIAEHIKTRFADENIGHFQKAYSGGGRVI